MVRDPLEGIKKEWLPLQIIHFSLIAGILIFLATVLLLSPEGLRIAYPADSVPFLIVNLCVALLPLIAVPIVKKSMYGPEKMKSEADIRKRFDAYRSYKVIQWALIEGPALMGVVTTLVVDNAVFLIFTIFHLAYLITTKPSKQEFQG